MVWESEKGVFFVCVSHIAELLSHQVHALQENFLSLPSVFFGVTFGFQQPRASVLPSVSRGHIRPRCLAFSQSHGAGETKQLDPRVVAIEI